jgi:hypothetical protein
MARKLPVFAATESVNRRPGMENGRHPTGKGFVYIRNGMKHREKGPAEINNDGYQAWYSLGLKHRVGGPAVTYPDGRMEWWEKGKLLKATNQTMLAPGTKVDMRAVRKDKKLSKIVRGR